MALVINAESAAAEPFGANVMRQRLLTAERVRGSHVRLDRWMLGAGASVPLEVPAGHLAWFQMLEGEATFAHAGGEEQLTSAYVAFLPPRLHGALASRAGAALLYAEVPDAARFDPEFSRNLNAGVRSCIHTLP